MDEDHIIQDQANQEATDALNEKYIVSFGIEGFSFSNCPEEVY